MISYRSGNPALTKNTFNNSSVNHADNVMTLDGTVNKTALSLLILMGCAFYTFTNNNTNFIWMGIIAGTILALATIFKKDLINNGVDYIMYLSCASGINGYNQIICNPSEKKIGDGDILIIDTGSTLNGYYCDFDRNFGFGNINQKSLDAYNKLWNATEKTLEIIKPGISCKEVYESLSKNLFSSNVKSSVGRMGHGFGLQLTEPPSIMIDDNTILEKNMILALEPSIEIENDLMLVHEENILITQNGNRLLSSRTPKELPVINV